MAQMRKVTLILLFLLAAVLGGLAAEPIRAGGCCLVVTLEELPPQVVAGQPLRLTFTARINSQKWSAWRGTITAVHVESGQTVQMDVVPSDEPGRYTVELVLPIAGEWRWSIYEHAMPLPPLMVQPATSTADTPSPAFDAPMAAGVGALLATVAGLFLWLRQRTPYRLAFLVLAAVVAASSFALRAAPGAVLAERETAVPAIAPEEMGEALFVAKGCIICHRHDGVTITKSVAQVGPDLTHYQGNPDFLRRWLGDPRAIRPDTFMPNLDLSQAEIETLIAFLSPEMVP